MKIPDVAKCAYECVRAYNQQVFGDFSQQPWDKLTEGREEFAGRVLFIVENRGAPASALHDRWMANLMYDGWRWAEFTDPKQKVHTRLKPWTQLPRDEQVRDKLFMRVVEALLESL